MTVADLIAKLQDVPADSEVVIFDHDTYWLLRLHADGILWGDGRVELRGHWDDRVEERGLRLNMIAVMDSAPERALLPPSEGSTYLADRETVINWAWERHKIRLGEMRLADVRTTCDRLFGTETDEEATLAEAFAAWAGKVREEG